MMPSLHINPPLVLIVEDDIIIQMQLRRSMEKEGYNVMTADDGQEALDIYTQLRPDIVLLDAVMPVMDGFACCTQLQAFAKGSTPDNLIEQPPVLMITGLDDPDSVDKAFAAGATDYITKPVHWAMLRQRVRRLLQMQWAMKELRRKVEQEQLIAKITQKIRQSLKLEVILHTTVTEVRKLLATDQVIVCQFQADGYGTIFVESMAPSGASHLSSEIKHCCSDEYTAQNHKKANIYFIEDISVSGFPNTLIKLPSELYGKDKLVIPVVQKEHLWGLLIAYQYSVPRQWQQLEVELLKPIADQLAIAIQQAELYEQLEVVNQELQNLATIDSLTQIANRRCFDESLLREWQRMEREHSPLSLIFSDIDCFKSYNDTYGHQAGDECLKQVAKILRQHSQRPADVVARYGGEEFALILPNTDIKGAVGLAETIRTHIKAKLIAHVGSHISDYLTISSGVATVIPDTNISPEWLIAKADAALYQAKQAGRDRVGIALYS